MVCRSPVTALARPHRESAMSLRTLAARFSLCLLTVLPGCNQQKAQASERPTAAAAVSSAEQVGPTKAAAAQVQTERAANGGASKAGPRLSPPVRQIIISYKGSSRAPASVTRTRKEAETRANHVLEEARGKTKFEDLVFEYSDDANKQKDLGYVGPISADTIFKQLYQTAAELGHGGTAVAHSPFGYHVLKRID